MKGLFLVQKEGTMIQVNELTKVYKLSKKQMAKMKTKEKIKCAADSITLTANPGEIYGLLGPNGAGKTTTLRCIATLLKPTEGSATVCGFDTVTQSEQVRRSIAFLTNEIKLDPKFSADYLFDFMGHLHEMKEADIAQRKEKLFDYFGITEFSKKKVEELSTGMKQKAAIAVSLAHDPEVIIFDEPTNGLDIITAKSVTDYLIEMKKMGKTIVISTHIMADVEKLCDRIGIIVEGKKVAEGTLPEILETTNASTLEDAFFILYRNSMKEDSKNERN